MRKILSVTVALAVAVSMIIPGPGLIGAEGSKAFAAEKGADRTGTLSTMQEIAEQLGDTSNDPFDFTKNSDKKDLLKKARSDDPKFDLRSVDTDDDSVGDTSYVTPVKLQNPWGNCWGFAAVTAAETSILGDDELCGDYVADVRKEDPASGKIQMDLSEKQMTYFSRTVINDPDNPQNGEGDEPVLLPGDDPVGAAYNLGGMAPTATSVFASGVGPVLESEDPLYEYHGRKGMRQAEWVDGRYQDFCYSPNDDWTLDESMRFAHSFSLSESYALPSPAKITGEYDNVEYEYNPAGTAAIKEQLLQKRGVEIGYKEDTFNAAYTDHGDYINSNFAQYTFYPESAKHAVCIVGWDDNYSRENFRHPVDDPDLIEEGYTEEDTVPPADLFPDGRHEGATDGGNGAWLVKNSWGSGEEPFPNHGEGTWGIVDEKSGKHSGYFWLSYYDKSISTPEALDFELNEKTSQSYTDVIDQHDYMPINKYLAANVSKEVCTANIFKADVCEKLKQVSCETTYPNTTVKFEVYLLPDKYSTPVEGLKMATKTATFDYGGFHKVDLEDDEQFIIMRGQSYAIVVTQTVPDSSGSDSYAIGLKMGSGNAVVNEGESFLMADGEWYDLSDPALQEDLYHSAENAEGASSVDNFPIKGFAEEMPDIVLEVDYSGFLSPKIPGEDETPTAYFMCWLTNNTGDSDYGDVTPEWELSEGGEEILNLIDGRDPTRKTVTFNKYGWVYIIVKAKGIGTAICSVKAEPLMADITALKSGKDYFSVTVKKPIAEGISGYEVFYRVKGTSKWSVKEFGPDPLTFKVSGLKKGKRYEVKVRSFVDSAPGRFFSYEGMQELTDAIGLKNTLKASGKTVKVKASKLKKGSVKITRKNAVKVSKAKGKVTYKKVSVNKSSKKFKVNKKNGAITVKKGLKKGTYKVKIRVKAAGKGDYLAGSKNVTVKIRVK